MSKTVHSPWQAPLPVLRRSIRDHLWWITLVVISCGIFTFFVSAGGLKQWPVYGKYHDLLADGFRSGHLYLPVTPAQELINAKDPYDRVNIRYWMFDASYFKGKWYLYWGPLPALLQAAAKTVLNINRTIGDQYVALFFLCLAAWFSALLVVRMGRRLFPAVSRPLLALGTLALVCANPTLHCAATAGIYQMPIMAAQSCLLGGLVAAFDAVWHSDNSGLRHQRLFLAGLGFGLALACRVTVAPAIGVFVIVTLLGDAWNEDWRVQKLLVNGLWLGAPLTLIGCSLLYYNKLRFDNWFEFGVGVQTSGFPPFRTSSIYLLPNLYSYVWRPPVLSCQFPYVFQVWSMGAEAFPPGIQVPADYMIREPVVGWARAVPLTWLIPFGFLLAPRPFSLRRYQTRVYAWCLAVFTALASTSGIVAMGLYLATMRYLGDVSFGLVLLSLLAGYSIKQHRIGRAVPRLTSALFSILALASIVFGMLLGYQGYNGHFHTYNPELNAKLVKALSLCGDSKPVVPKFKPR